MKTEPSTQNRRDLNYPKHIVCLSFIFLYFGNQLPEVDLKAVILDTHASFRTPISNHPILHDSDHAGTRDAGFVSVIQWNYIFNRNIPVGAGPFQPMKSAEDKMLDAPCLQQQGVELILKVLRESPEPVSILSFGSARPIAVACNREPDLFYRKVARIYFSAASSSPGYLEWNIALDVNAALRLLRSNLPIDIFPCAAKKGPFEYEPHNSYWKLLDLQFIKTLDPKIRRYLDYAFGRACRCDFLRAMHEHSSPAPMIDAYSHPHHVWETAVWMALSDRVLGQRSDKSYRIIPAGALTPTDRVLPGRLEPCLLQVSNDGLFTFQITQPRRIFESTIERIPGRMKTRFVKLYPNSTDRFIPELMDVETLIALRPFFYS
ncbi:MAG: hypothetical protein ABSH39_14775 [Candidatus Acidiferrum sp.]|jgi:hypothetical protein